MARSTADIKFEKAQARNELAKYFGGYPDYAMTDIYADMPTDFGGAFTPIRMRIKNEPQLGGIVQTALLELSKDPEYGWTALEGLIQLGLIRNYQGIDLFDPDFLREIAQNLQANKDSLTACRKWKGSKPELGAWSLALSANRILRKDYNLIVLPEEL